MLQRILCSTAVLLVAAGCGPSKPPSGEVYEGKHVSEWGDTVHKSTDREARVEACKVIIRMGKEGVDARPAVEGLWRTINDEDPIIRGWASVAMIYAARGTPYPTGQVLVPKAKQAAESADEELRIEAKLVLERVPSPPAGQGGPPMGRPQQGAQNPADDKQPPVEESKPPPAGSKEERDPKKP
jgi:hypothetical protein